MKCAKNRNRIQKKIVGDVGSVIDWTVIETLYYPMAYVARYIYSHMFHVCNAFPLAGNVVFFLSEIWQSNEEWHGLKDYKLKLWLVFGVYARTMNITTWKTATKTTTQRKIIINFIIWSISGRVQFTKQWGGFYNVIGGKQFQCKLLSFFRKKKEKEEGKKRNESLANRLPYSIYVLEALECTDGYENQMIYREHIEHSHS